MNLEEHIKEGRLEVLRTAEKYNKEANNQKLEKLAQNMLRENINDPAGLYYLANVYARTHREEVAVTMLQKVVAFRPNNPDVWELMASCYDAMYMFEDAIACYKKALEIDPDRIVTLGSIASSYVGLSKPLLAIEYADKGLALNPENVICKANRGFANLMLGNWDNGWEGYDLLLGHPGTKRKQINYTNRSREVGEFWMGQDVDTLVIYTEQGIGDSIMFASCIADAQKHAKQIIIDCDEKLEGLFKRSFPDCIVYGTRHDPDPDWVGQYQIDDCIAIGSLPRLFRTKKEDFPRTPYLSAEKDRRAMYRSVFDSWGKRPKIGIAWTGGNMYGGFRRLELDKLQRIIESVDADFVSLQYKKTPSYDLPIKFMPYAAETNDYDDAAALVAELDLVISVPQACVHLAGALGKECWCLVPDATRWIYGVQGKEHSWYQSVELFRDWETNADEVIKRLQLRYPK